MHKITEEIYDFICATGALWICAQSNRGEMVFNSRYRQSRLYMSMEELLDKNLVRLIWFTSEADNGDITLGDVKVKHFKRGESTAKGGHAAIQENITKAKENLLADKLRANREAAKQ